MGGRGNSRILRKGEGNMAEKKFVFVCCGAGKLTSFMAAEGIKAGLKARNITDIKVQHGMINYIPRYQDKITALVCSTNYKQKHDFPVFNGLPFVIQDKTGEEKLLDELVEYLKK